MSVRYPVLLLGFLFGLLWQTATAAISDAQTHLIRGRVLDLAGKPATNVWVQVQTLDTNAAPDLRTGGWALASTNSGANGEFTLEVAKLPATWALLALQGDNVSWHERASLADSANARPITLELRPWPRINGSIRALDESPLGYSVAIEVETSATRAVPPPETAPANVATGDELKPGLVAEMFVFESNSRSLDDRWFTRTPLFRRIDTRINYPRSSDRFGDTGLTP
ncbi:MAG TPA: hypothetical protein VE988_14090 [Gemmataceae bacterium]|nr:hypothetical protein [Gemmataceae bacterium]